MLQGNEGSHGAKIDRFGAWKPDLEKQTTSYIHALAALRYKYSGQGDGYIAQRIR